MTEVENSEKKTHNHYHYSSLYKLVRIGSDVHVCVKQTKQTPENQLIYMVPVEDYYEKLLEAHINTAHGGRDRMFHYISKRWKIVKKSCEIFTSLCGTCSRKKGFAKQGLVVKPIITHGFNVRCQVDLVDFQSCPDGTYKMNF